MPPKDKANKETRVKTSKTRPKSRKSSGGSLPMRGGAIYDDKYVNNSANFIKGSDGLQYIKYIDTKDFLLDFIDHNPIPKENAFVLNTQVYNIDGLFAWVIEYGNHTVPHSNEAIDKPLTYDQRWGDDDDDDDDDDEDKDDDKKNEARTPQIPRIVKKYFEVHNKESEMTSLLGDAVVGDEVVGDEVVGVYMMGGNRMFVTHNDLVATFKIKSADDLWTRFLADTGDIRTTFVEQIKQGMNHSSSKEILQVKLQLNCLIAIEALFKGQQTTRDPNGNRFQENGGIGGGVATRRTNGQWSPTGRKVTLKDGTKRALYSDPSKPGDLRMRKMARRGGKVVATYVKVKPNS